MDWGRDPNDRQSTSRLCIYFGGNLITCSLKKQAFISRSSTEVEYKSLASTVTEIIWLQSLPSKLGLPLTLVPSIYYDNQSAVLLIANHILHNRSKHFELDLYFVREHAIQKKNFVNHIPSHEQMADILIKAISSTQFLIFRTKLKVETLPLWVWGGLLEYSSHYDRWGHYS